MQTKLITISHPVSPDAIDAMIAQARADRSQALSILLRDAFAGLKHIAVALRPARQKLPLNGRWA
jgi:hypothetical protein